LVISKGVAAWPHDSAVGMRGIVARNWPHLRQKTNEIQGRLGHRSITSAAVDLDLYKF